MGSGARTGACGHRMIPTEHKRGASPRASNGATASKLVGLSSGNRLPYSESAHKVTIS